MTAWAGMETAPRTGVPVLLWLRHPIDPQCLDRDRPRGEPIRVVIGWWDGVSWVGDLTSEASRATDGWDPGIAIDFYPSHWAPLPEAPSEAEVRP